MQALLAVVFAVSLFLFVGGIYLIAVVGRLRDQVWVASYQLGQLRTEVQSLRDRAGDAGRFA